MRTPESRRTRPGRPSPRRQERKRQRQGNILAAAFEVFATHGFEAARLDEVARRAGVAKGTIYLYFRDKEELFRAVVRTLVQRKIAAIPETVQGTGEQMLRELISRMYGLVVTNDKVRAIVRLLIAEGGRFPQLSEIYHREVIGPGMKAVRQILQHGISTGEFRPTAAVEFPQLLAAPGVLAIVWRVLHGDRHRIDLDAYRQAHLEFILDSLRRPGGTKSLR